MNKLCKGPHLESRLAPGHGLLTNALWSKPSCPLLLHTLYSYNPSSHPLARARADSRILELSKTKSVPATGSCFFLEWLNTTCLGHGALSSCRACLEKNPNLGFLETLLTCQSLFVDTNVLAWCQEKILGGKT